MPDLNALIAATLSSIGDRLAVSARERMAMEQQAELERLSSAFLNNYGDFPQSKFPNQGDVDLNQLNMARSQKANDAFAKILSQGGGSFVNSLLQMQTAKQPQYDVVGDARNGYGLVTKPYGDVPTFAPFASITSKKRMNSQYDPNRGVIVNFDEDTGAGQALNVTGLPNMPIKQDTSKTPYEDFRSGYPNTTEGSQQAARDYFGLQTRNSIARAEGIRNSRPDKLVNKIVDRDGITHYTWQTPEGDVYESVESDTRAATAGQREKVDARSLATDSIQKTKELGDKVITERTAIEQRAKAVGMSLEAYTANNPDYITYRDARMALAGNLAVLQQGSRPSDADIKSIWLPLVPDPYSDTKESAEMKWNLIKIMTKTGNAAGTGNAVPSDSNKRQTLDEIFK